MISEREKNILSEHAFIRCLHTGDFTASEKIDEISEDIKRKRNEIQVLKDKIVQKINDFMGLKTLSDYYLFELEKLSGVSRRTLILDEDLHSKRFTLKITNAEFSRHATFVCN